MQMLPLPVVDTKTNFYYKPKELEQTCLNIEDLLKNVNFNNDILFARKVLFPYDIKFNNGIEGYNEDIESIIQIINNPNHLENKIKEEYRRVKNLMIGYKYILEKKDITKDNLKYLYSLLSHKLLENGDIIPSNQYYRSNDVFIHFSSRIDIEPDKGIDASKLDEYMAILFDYINNKQDLNSISKVFLKSQIIHYYFVYLHPYYDINGRTSRTLSLWYLLMNDAYHFTLFNRGIPYSKQHYYKLIRHAKFTNNLTSFLSYMLNNVKKEMQKEHLINDIENVTNENLTFLERQTLQYIIENKVDTVLDYGKFYNRFNRRKKVKEIYEMMLLPLFEKDILLPIRDSKKIMYDNKHNIVYNLNPKKTDMSILRK